MLKKDGTLASCKLFVSFVINVHFKKPFGLHCFTHHVEAAWMTKWQAWRLCHCNGCVQRISWLACKTRNTCFGIYSYYTVFKYM